MVSSIAPPQADLGSMPGNGMPGIDSQLQHEQQFASLLRSTPIERLDAQPAAAGDDIVSAAASRLDAIAQNLRPEPVTDVQAVGRGALLAGDPASASPPAAGVTPDSHTSLRDEVNGLLDDYRRTVSFSIQAQVTATGSTTTTKTFNQLMRGS
jgi:hypothetical protein